MRSIIARSVIPFIKYFMFFFMIDYEYLHVFYVKMVRAYGKESLYAVLTSEGGCCKWEKRIRPLLRELSFSLVKFRSYFVS